MRIPSLASIAISCSLFLSTFLSTTEARLGKHNHIHHQQTTTTYDDYYSENHKYDTYINQPLYSQETCHILALSGGGSFGAVEMGILAELIEQNKVPTTFDIITGISAGGLNAGFLSYYHNISDAIPEMYSIYSSINNKDIYNLALLKIAKEYSIYDTSPLVQTLTNILSNKQPQPNSPITLIGASNVLQHTLDVFRFDTKSIEDRVDILMATSAIPLVFPPKIINGSYYVDGGVISNEMIFEALGVLNCSNYDFTFISASNHQPSTKQIYGFFSYISSVMHLLFETFDYQLSEFSQETCQNPRGTIHACFPNSPDLENYSILDFDYGSTLFQLGKSNHYCVDIPLC